jgi:hypothetical protein
MSSPHVLIIVGDSNSRGQGDDDAFTLDGLPFGIAGFPERAAVLAGIPSAKCAAGGTGQATWNDPADTYWDYVAALGGTMASISEGTNRGLDTGAQLAAGLEVLLGIAADIGLLPIACTIPPTADFGDAFADTARIAANNLIRAGLASAAWTADVASAVEGDVNGAITLDGGWWRSTAGANPYGTDLHYTSLGHAAAGVVLADAITNLIAGNRGGLSQSADL